MVLERIIGPSNPHPNLPQLTMQPLIKYVYEPSVYEHGSGLDTRTVDPSA